jgi:hypothetical protein
MTVGIPQSNVVLFPLCDKSGLMSQVLCPESTDRAEPERVEFTERRSFGRRSKLALQAPVHSSLPSSLHASLNKALGRNPKQAGKRVGTRPDAIVFAWLLDLPAEIDSADAARAVITCNRHQVAHMDAYQRSVLAELVKLLRDDQSSWRLLPHQKSQKKLRGQRRHSDKTSLLTQSLSGKSRRFVCLSGGKDA